MVYEAPKMVVLGSVSQMTQGPTAPVPCTEPGTNFQTCAISYFCLQNPGNPNCT